MSKALLYDATLCIGCKACEEGCANENGLPYDPAIAKQEQTSSTKYTAVLSHSVVRDYHRHHRCYFRDV